MDSNKAFYILLLSALAAHSINGLPVRTRRSMGAMRMGKRLSETAVAPHQPPTDSELLTSSDDDIYTPKSNAVLQQLQLAISSDHETRIAMLNVAKQILALHQIERELLNGLESGPTSQPMAADTAEEYSGSSWDRLKESLDRLRPDDKRQIKTLRMGR